MLVFFPLISILTLVSGKLGDLDIYLFIEYIQTVQKLIKIIGI